MKKNVVGNVPMHKEPLKHHVADLHIPARLFCLVLAIIIWLSVSNLTASAAESEFESVGETTQTEATL